MGCRPVACTLLFLRRERMYMVTIKIFCDVDGSTDVEVQVEPAGETDTVGGHHCNAKKQAWWLDEEPAEKLYCDREEEEEGFLFDNLD